MKLNPSELADKIEKLWKAETGKDDSPWYIEMEPHNYKDGTDHFTHVRYDTRDSAGEVVNVEIARYLTPELADLLVTLHNNLETIVKALRKE